MVFCLVGLGWGGLRAMDAIGLLLEVQWLLVVALFRPSICSPEKIEDKIKDETDKIKATRNSHNIKGDTGWFENNGRLQKKTLETGSTETAFFAAFPSGTFIACHTDKDKR